MEVRLDSALVPQVPRPQPPPEEDLDLLRPGRILLALVTAANGDGLARLRVGNLDLVAESRVPLQEGERLQLEVIDGGKTPLLQIRNPQESRPLVAATLRLVLPKMAALPQALADLQALEAQLETAPAGVRQALAQVMARLPEPEQAMDPSGLRQILEESGTWSEARMVQGQTGPADLKQALLQAAARVRTRLIPKGKASPPEGARGAALPAKAGPAPRKAGAAAHPNPSRGSMTSPSGQRPQVSGNGAPLTQRASPSRPMAAIPSVPPGPDAKQSEPAPGRERAPLGKDPTLPTQVRLQAQRPTQPPQDPAPPKRGESRASISAQPRIDRPLPPGRESARIPHHRDDEWAPRGDAAANLRLLRDLEPPLEAALARIRYHQLGSLPSSDPNPQVWQFELPLATREGFTGLRLRIEEHDREQPDPGMRHWSVTLEFDFPSLGRIRARVGLQGEQVSGTFWSERPGTLALIQGELERLRAGLEAKGLAVERLGAHPGAGPNPQATSSQFQGALLSERA